MKPSKRLLLALIALILTIQLCNIPVYTSRAIIELNDVPTQVECLLPEIPPGTPEPIRVTIGSDDEPPGTGKAILLVIQPNKAPIEEDFEEWLRSMGFTDEQIEKITSKIGSKSINVMGYLKIAVPGGEPYTNTFTYPDDFTPIIGDLSTKHSGKYKVVLVYCGVEFDCISITVKYGFECTQFFVIPEVPFGTIFTAVIFFSALIVHSKLRILFGNG